MKWIILTLLFCSCSSAALLKKAEKLIEKAERKGAKWKTDTAFHVVKLKTDPIKVVFTPKPLILNDTIVFRDSVTRVVTKVLIKEKTVAATTACPEVTKYVKVPYQVTKTIEAKIPITWWRYIISIVISLVVAFVLGYFYRTIQAFLRAFI